MPRGLVLGGGIIGGKTRSWQSGEQATNKSSYMNSLIQSKSPGRVSTRRMGVWALLVSICAWGFFISPSIAANDNDAAYTFHNAIVEGDAYMVLGMLEAGMDADKVYQGASPVQRAIKLERNAIFKLLLDRKASQTGDDFIYAIELGNTFVAKEYLERGMSANAADPYEMTALQHAALNGRTEIVRLLLEKMADVNAREVVNGYNALILASAHGYVEIVKLLLAAGADRNVVTDDGYTAISWAEERSRAGSSHGEILRLLQQ